MHVCIDVHWSSHTFIVASEPLAGIAAIVSMLTHQIQIAATSSIASTHPVGARSMILSLAVASALVMRTCVVICMVHTSGIAWVYMYIQRGAAKAYIDTRHLCVLQRQTLGHEAHLHTCSVCICER